MYNTESQKIQCTLAQKIQCALNLRRFNVNQIQCAYKSKKLQCESRRFNTVNLRRLCTRIHCTLCIESMKIECTLNLRRFNVHGI